MPKRPSYLLCHGITGLQAELDAGAFVQVCVYRPVFMCVYLSICNTPCYNIMKMDVEFKEKARLVLAAYGGDTTTLLVRKYVYITCARHIYIGLHTALL
jgi:hypothetical protein